ASSPKRRRSRAAAGARPRIRKWDRRTSSLGCLAAAVGGEARRLAEARNTESQPPEQGLRRRGPCWHLSSEALCRPRISSADSCCYIRPRHPAAVLCGILARRGAKHCFCSGITIPEARGSSLQIDHNSSHTALYGLTKLLTLRRSP